MKKIKTLFGDVLAYINRKENEKNINDAVKLLMQLVYSGSVENSVNIKQQFDFEFSNELESRKNKLENELKAINNYENDIKTFTN